MEAFRHRKGGRVALGSSKQESAEMTPKGLASAPCLGRDDDRIATLRTRSGRQVAETTLAGAVLAVGLAPPNTSVDGATGDETPDRQDVPHSPPVSLDYSGS